MEDNDDLAHEWLLGTLGPKGRQYLKPNSERELKARAVVAQHLRAEAPNGYFTNRVADLIDPPRSSAVIKRKIVFQRPRGTPVVVSARRRVEIAAFMQRQLEAQKRGNAASAAQAKNLKRVVSAVQNKFHISRSTVMNIWQDFRPPKNKEKSRPERSN